MSDSNKAVLRSANAAIDAGDTEGFLTFCTDDIVWTAVGEMTLRGKAAVRKWMATAYSEPPQYTVEEVIAEGDFVIALGHIMVKDGDGHPIRHAYSDVWRFREGKMAELRAFVIKAPSK
jgi:uncharacterized protein (TIGR02246 family)